MPTFHEMGSEKYTGLRGAAVGGFGLLPQPRDGFQIWSTAFNYVKLEERKVYNIFYTTYIILIMHCDYNICPTIIVSSDEKTGNKNV